MLIQGLYQYQNARSRKLAESLGTLYRMSVYRAKMSDRIIMKFCTAVEVLNIITCTNDDYWFQYFGIMGVKFYTFPLTCVVVLKTL